MDGEGRRLGPLNAQAENGVPRPGLDGPGRRRLSFVWLGVTPFFIFAVAFLLLPAGAILTGAFRNKTGDFTLDNISTLLERQFLSSYWQSIKLSLVTAALGGVLGLLIAYAAIREGTPRFFRPLLTTFSGVAANFAGIPLAFAFIATLGTIGIVTAFLRDQLGFDLYGHGFSLFTFTGVALAYLYFQIPLMILVIAPAIDGLRTEWREAATGLGASSAQYWRHIGLPVLLPSLLGAFILLFGNAFSAYATAFALTAGGAGVNLVPITIGTVVSGNVLDNPHLGQALALGMFVVLAAMMAIYIPLQRRTSRWTR